MKPLKWCNLEEVRDKPLNGVENEKHLILDCKKHEKKLPTLIQVINPKQSLDPLLQNLNSNQEFVFDRKRPDTWQIANPGHQVPDEINFHLRVIFPFLPAFGM